MILPATNRDTHEWPPGRFSNANKQFLARWRQGGFDLLDAAGMRETFISISTYNSIGLPCPKNFFPCFHAE